MLNLFSTVIEYLWARSLRASSLFGQPLKDWGRAGEVDKSIFPEGQSAFLPLSVCLFGVSYGIERNSDIIFNNCDHISKFPAKICGRSSRAVINHD